MRLLLRIAAVAIAFAAATYVIILDIGSDIPLLGRVSTVVVAAISVLELSDRLLWGHIPFQRRRRRATVAAREALNDIYSSQTLTLDYQLMSIHVWEVPRWYRFLFQFRFREFLRRHINDRHAYRPHLRRLAHYCADPADGARHKWRKTEGIFRQAMGRDHRNRNPVAEIDYRRQEYADLAAANDEEAWDQAHPRLTLGMSYEQFLSVYEKYAQVVAIGLRRNGENVGCLTLEAREEAREQIIGNSALYDKLVELSSDITEIVIKDRSS